MSTMVSPVLAELETRAGASDRDRDAWLAERALGVTATEIRDLYLKGPTYRRELVEKKLGLREDSFTGNGFTAWGTEREPVIAEAVRQRFAILPESRVFRSAKNPRFLASPDGLGVNFDDELSVAEIKTAGVDIRLGSEAFKSKGYDVQMTWAMFVTGARRCLYATEQRIDAGGQFHAGEQSFEWFDFDPVLALDLEQVAVEFLAELDAARAARDAGEGPVVDEELDTLAVNLLRFREMEAEGKRAKEAAWSEMQALLSARGGDFSQESTLARITYTAASETTVDQVDNDAAIDASETSRKRWESLLRARAALAKKEAAWAEYSGKFVREVASTRKPNLTVMSVKQKETKK